MAAAGNFLAERKIISVSTKRQVTIPQKFFDMLGFQNEAECILKDDGIFIRPVRMGGSEFAENILEDLIAQGYSGKELLEKFKEQRKNPPGSRTAYGRGRRNRKKRKSYFFG